RQSLRFALRALRRTILHRRGGGLDGAVSSPHAASVSSRHGFLAILSRRLRMIFDRRHFLGLAGLGTAGALIAPQTPQPMPPDHGPAPNAAPPPFELDEITVG